MLSAIDAYNLATGKGRDERLLKLALSCIEQSAQSGQTSCIIDDSSLNQQVVIALISLNYKVRHQPSFSEFDIPYYEISWSQEA